MKLTLEQLTAGIQDRNQTKSAGVLVEKWSKTSLLRGLSEDRRSVMAQLLENQAAHLLRESNALGTGGASGVSTGQVQGFTAIAFPMVRRVFGGLVANELVSIQPMSLPNGLVFYIDYTYGTNVGLDGTAGASTYSRGQSIYNNPAGKGIQSGSLAAGGMYDNVGSGYSRVHSGSATVSGSGLDVGAWTGAGDVFVAGGIVSTVTSFTGTNARMGGFDPQIETALYNSTLDLIFAHISVAQLATAIPKGDVSAIDQIAISAVATTNGAIAWGPTFQAGSSVLNLRRANKRGNWDGANFVSDPFAGSHVQFALALSNGGAAPVLGAATKVSMVVSDTLVVDGTSGAVLTIPSFESDFGATPSPAIPEIDIKIESISINSEIRKLRARWTPELAQDLNAYHTIDAEVELTRVLSEQIALEIDREILQDLLVQANTVAYWSRAPGKFVNKRTGAEITLANSLSAGPRFTGTVQEWYATLVETICDVANTIHVKTLRASANFIVTGPDVCTILEQTVPFRGQFSIDSDGQVSSPMTIGAEKIGTVNNRFTVYKDPYFARNKILVGYKGKGQLEAGYVYAPYIPLMVTPVIFSPEDFTPRRGVMTRYARKMIRSDYFSSITVLDMNTI